MPPTPQSFNRKTIAPQGTKYALGLLGQALAQKHLEKSGLVLLAMNYRTRLGEIDLVMLDADSVVFVEVKTRRTVTKGSALEAVTRAKQIQIGKMAQIYLQSSKLGSRTTRFDVVGVLLGNPPTLHWIKRAFEHAS